MASPNESEYGTAEPGSSRVPRRLSPPIITINSMNLEPRPEEAPQASLLHLSHVRNRPSLTTGPASLVPPSGSTSPAVYDPAWYPSNSFSSALQIPYPKTHVRSNSAGTNATERSGWSGWSPSSPGSSGRISDFGDDEDLRQLLKSIGDSEDTIAENPFAFTKLQLGKNLYDSKDLNVLRAVKGLEGLTMGLRTDVENGVPLNEDRLEGQVTIEDIWQDFESPQRERFQEGHASVNQMSDDTPGLRTVTSVNVKERFSYGFLRRPKPQSRREFFTDRSRVFGDNRIPQRPAKNMLQLMWIAFQDKVIILLSVAAVVSLALGLYQTLRPGSTNKLEWIEGVAILTAVTIVTVAQSVNDYQKERQFAKLNHKREDRQVKVVRGGQTLLISVYDLLVGDILLLEAGDIVPVDAILAEGHDVRCDESSVTGESNTSKKVPLNVALEHAEAGDTKNSDPFIISGTKVLEGVGRCVVTSVGTNSCYGRMMLSFQDEPEATPLQIRLDRIADMIAKWGGGIALLLFIILVIMFIIRLPGSNMSPSMKGEHLMQILIVSVSIVVVAVPEGLPLAVTLSLAYATIRMIEDNNLVRVLKACETVGNATTICSDKTGTLTENKMTVVAGTLGMADKFVRGDAEESSTLGSRPPVEQRVGAITMESFFPKLPKQLTTLLRDSIALNSTAFEGIDDERNKVFIGSKTETALLEMAKRHLDMDDVTTERRNAKSREIQLFPFSSERKCMGIIMEIEVAGRTVQRLYVKGASELILEHSDQIIDPSTSDPENLTVCTLSPEDRRVVSGTIEDYASHSLRTIALAFRDFSTPPSESYAGASETEAKFEFVFREMVFIGVVGIKDPLRPGVTKAVDDCRKAGVMVRMVTGDNISTAKAVATECGIYTDGIVMEGLAFRKLTRSQMYSIIPRLQVLARASPEDKRILVKRLKHLRQVVAVTGDGTNDAPALHAADVGFSMGIAGTEVAKAASSIILMDDNFASIVRAIAWGRCVNDAVKKFIQFQLTVSVTAVGFAFVSSITSGDESSALTAVQLLWVNLIQDTLAALALATDPPTLDLLDRQPEPKGASLISFNMWKMIFGQSIVQLVVIFVLNFAGKKIFPNVDNGTLKTMVFNTFVWLQIFNEINCRRLDNKINVFSGIQRNPLFMVILVVMVVCQIMIIFIGGQAFSVTRLNSQHWLVCIFLGFCSIPAGAIIRLLPNSFIKLFLPKCILERRTYDDEERQIEDWDDAIEAIQDDLRFFKRLRGGARLKSTGKRRTEPGGSSVEGCRSAPTQPSSLDDEPGIINHPRASSRQPRSQLYSVNSATSLVPALVLLSTALPPVANADNPSVVETGEEIVNIGGSVHQPGPSSSLI